MDSPKPRRGRPSNPDGPLSSTERAARSRAERRRVEALLTSEQSAALNRLTADGTGISDAIGAAILRAASE